MKKLLFAILILSGLVVFGYYRKTSSLSYFIRIPIEKPKYAYQLPLVSTEIQGKKYKLEIDTGTQMPLSLCKEVLANIEKENFGNSHRIDFRGNKYVSPLYKINGVKIDNYQLDQVETKEESNYFDDEAGVLVHLGGEKIHSGRIGRNFFSGKNIFFDLKHNTLILCKHLGDLTKNGYKTDHFIPVPFSCTKEGIIFEIATESGSKKFALDSGSTLSIIRSSETINKNLISFKGLPAVETSQFVMNQVDFGKGFYLF